MMPTQSRFQPRLAAILLLALVAGAATDARAQTLYSQTFPVRAGGALAVDVGSGSVRVETTAGNEATVTVEATGRNARAAFERLRFTAAVTGNRLVVRTQPRRGVRMSNVSFVYTVRIPRRFDASIDTGSGSVRVGPLDGRLSVDTGSGSVATDDVRGDVTIDTGSGSVRLGRITGRLSVDTGSGSVAVAEQTGAASIDTGSGSVTIALARVAPLSVTTGSGSARVALPRGASADLSAEGSTVTVDAALAFSGRRERDEATGRLGRGGDRLRVETGSGSVSLTVR